MSRTTVSLAAKSLLVASLTALSCAQRLAAEPPYPRSEVIENIKWHWETHQTAAPGSDLWPVTWGPDDHLYAAWGDGGGFGGTNVDGRVSMGFARIEGPPEKYRGININGGKRAEHPASFPQTGKTGGILFVDGTLYARLNLQDGKWPNVSHSLCWSTDRGANWEQASWVFPKGQGNFKPARFLNFGRDYAGVPKQLRGYVYLTASDRPLRVRAQHLPVARLEDEDRGPRRVRVFCWNEKRSSDLVARNRIACTGLHRPPWGDSHNGGRLSPDA